MVSLSLIQLLDQYLIIIKSFLNKNILPASYSRLKASHLIWITPKDNIHILVPLMEFLYIVYGVLLRLSNSHNSFCAKFICLWDIQFFIRLFVAFEMWFCYENLVSTKNNILIFDYWFRLKILSAFFSRLIKVYLGSNALFFGHGISSCL